MVDSEELESRTRQFFTYFRERHQTAAREDIPLPDRLVVLSASLDALAKHWSDTSTEPGAATKISAKKRMHAFLITHGAHPAFAKVSAPMMRNATGREVGNFPFAAYRPNEMNHVRSWRDDPDYSNIEGSVSPEELLRWSYPGILYVDLRCAWVHEFVQTNDKLHVSEADFFGRREPYYRYLSPAGLFFLMIPVPFLLDSLNAAINSFESAALTHSVLPFLESPSSGR
jgi:hypothetical protein